MILRKETRMKTKILIIEAYTDSNIGSCALVENSIHLLKMKYPESEIRLMAHYPKAFIERYEGVEVVKDIFNYPYLRNRGFQYWWLFSTLVWMLFVYVLPRKISYILFKNKVKDFLWSDSVVSIGAERINDKYIKNAFFSEYTYKLIKRFKKKMVLFPCTIGPFLHGWTKKIFTLTAKDIDMIYTRDVESYNISKQLLPDSQNKLINTCDVAVFQSWVDKKKDLNKEYGKPIVGISIMKWSYVANKYETPYSNYKAYVNEIVSLIDVLIERYNVHVTLFPTNYRIHGGLADDLGVAHEIYNLSTRKKDLNIIEDLTTPSEFKSLLSGSEINITTRMHACILSTGAFVPTISINYLFKLKEYMNSIGLSDFALDIEDFEHSIILDMFDKMWNNRNYWTNHLKNEINKNKQNLLTAMNELDGIL